MLNSYDEDTIVGSLNVMETIIQSRTIGALKDHPWPIVMKQIVLLASKEYNFYKGANPRARHIVACLTLRRAAAAKEDKNTSQLEIDRMIQEAEKVIADVKSGRSAHIEETTRQVQGYCAWMRS